MGRKDIQRRPHNPNHPPALIAAMHAFLQHLRSRRYSPASIGKRHDAILSLFDYLHQADISSLRDISPLHLHHYLAWLHARNYSPHTIESAITSAKALFAWLHHNGTIFEDPAARLKSYARAKHQLGLVLDHDQIRALLAAPDLTEPTGLRDRAILETLYATGIRLHECTILTVFDIDLQNQTINIHGKGAKQRLIPLGSAATDYLRRYLQLARVKLNTRSHADPVANTALWLSRTGAPLGIQSIRLAVSRYIATAHLPQETDTHTIRRTCATHLLQGGAHPVIVAAILGHSDLKTLSSYLKVSIADLQRTHAQTNPGN